MPPRVVYVVSTYFGARQCNEIGYDADRGVFLRRHLAHLRTMAHGLAEIVVVVNGTEPVPPDIDLSGMTLLRRPNVGFSYGAYVAACEPRLDQTDYFILTEDDYVFTQPRFDAWLVERMLRRPEVGWLCGANYRDGNDPYPVAAIGLGMVSARVLRSALAAGARLYVEGDSADKNVGNMGQRWFSWGLIHGGACLGDWLEEYASAYWHSVHYAWSPLPSGQLQPLVSWWTRPAGDQGDPRLCVGDLTRPSFVAPIQALDRRVLMSDKREWWTGIMRADGHLADLTKGGELP